MAENVIKNNDKSTLENDIEELKYNNWVRRNANYLIKFLQRNCHLLNINDDNIIGHDVYLNNPLNNENYMIGSIRHIMPFSLNNFSFHGAILASVGNYFGSKIDELERKINELNNKIENEGNTTHS